MRSLPRRRKKKARGVPEGLTQSYLRHYLSYDPETGLLTKNHRPEAPQSFNTRWAGKPAGSVGHKGYIFISIHNKQYTAHRLAWLYMTGELPQVVDHINNIAGDNRFCNLRAATIGQNGHNSKKRKNNKSGYKGVSWNKNAQKWVAQIKLNWEPKYLGLFNCPTAAHFAYCKAAKELHGEYARFA